MAAGRNIELLSTQIAEFKPKLVCVQMAEDVDKLIVLLKQKGVSQGDMPELCWGSDGIVAVATVDGADTVVTGIVGCAGLLPTVAAIKAGELSCCVFCVFVLCLCLFCCDCKANGLRFCYNNCAVIVQF
jgi:1-deoxy-D-xylulose-5-phosphate reductoisomerase